MKVREFVRGYREELTLAISIVALALSAFSIYIQFREVDAVTIRLVDMDTTIEKHGNATMKLVLANSGTLPYLVSEVRMVVTGNADGTGVSYPSDGSTLVKEAPFVLDKGNMRLLEVTVPVSEIIGMPGKSVPAYIGAMVTSVDVYGELHRADLWFAAVCAHSDMLIDGITNDEKFSLKPPRNLFFKHIDKNPCGR